jgi:hypothetical protein
LLLLYPIHKATIKQPLFPIYVVAKVEAVRLEGKRITGQLLSCQEKDWERGIRGEWGLSKQGLGLIYWVMSVAHLGGRVVSLLQAP